jgi:hypothetical protein
MRLSAKLPQDDEGAKLMRFEDVRGQRYTEIFLIGGHAITRHLVGTADDGAVKITQDELGNTYDRVGGPYSNYKP